MGQTALIVIGSGRQSFREYILEGISRHRTVVLIDEKQPGWQRRYITDYAVAPVFDQNAVCAAACIVGKRYDVGGVLTYDESLAEVTAAVAARLALPYSSVSAVQACRDKLVTRYSLAAWGVPSARFREVSTADEAVTAAAALGYPAVLKPRSLASSIGVVKVMGPADVNSAFDVASSARIHGFPARSTVLVEEYLDGPEISVDAVVTDDAIYMPVIARKQLGFAPFFEETGHVVSEADPIPGFPQVQDLVRSAIRALGLRSTIAHVEVRLTAAGPRIVEVNPRLGGDLIPYLGMLANGVDLAVAAADLATGAQPTLRPLHSRAAAIRFFYPKVPMIFGSFALSAKKPRWLNRLVALIEPGTAVRPPMPTDESWPRLGYAIVTGEDAQQCQARLNEVEASLHYVQA